MKNQRKTIDSRAEPRDRDQSGSALIIAIFVLVLVAVMGVALLFLSGNEVRLSQADLRSKTVYYFTEAGLEDGRASVWAANLISTNPLTLDDELVNAAGFNTNLEFDLANVSPVFDSSGTLTGVTGAGDDRPAAILTDFAGGRYIAYMTNDPAETTAGGRFSKTDSNDRVLLTALGAGPERTVEVVQAIVERRELYPEMPAAITILGEASCTPPDCALFHGGNSTPKRYIGDDTGPHCPGGIPSLNVPVVGVIGGSSVGSAQTGVIKPGSYQTGGVTGPGTVVDLQTTGTLAPLWTSCTDIIEFARLIRSVADVIGNSGTSTSLLGTPGDGKIVFIQDDYAVNGSISGAGVLFVTGDFDFAGLASWQGPVFAIGTGNFIRSGGGNGDITGGILVADVAGPDGLIFTADDCSGQDGVHGTADDGIAQGSFDVPGAGNSTTGYCSAHLRYWQANRPLEIVSFLQH